MDDESEPVKVFCRVRTLMGGTECISVEREGLRMIPPPGARRNHKEALYSFSGIYTDDNNQSEIFHDVAHPLVDDLIHGKNGLLFTYGVTGSGKTYTMQGNEENPGIVPRALKSLFSRIKVMSRCRVISDRRNGFKVSSAIDALDIVSRFKNQFKRPTSDVSSIAYLNKVENINVDNEVINNCTVIISLVEIYGKHIHDLLATKSDIQKEITIKEDVKRNKYLHNVVEIEVQSAEEAFYWYLEGQKNRKVESTKLNNESSRSHMVFNIRLVKLDDTLDYETSSWNSTSSVVHQRNWSNVCGEFGIDLKPTIVDHHSSNWKLQSFYKEESDKMWVSQLSLVDLAGSERANRSGTKGTRLKEAGDINNSLMVLRRCMELLREKNRQSATKPDYRSSELTHLFKTTLEGGSALRMIICIQSCPEEYDETMTVLQFAENTQEISMPIQKNPELFKAVKSDYIMSLTKEQQIDMKLNDIWGFVSKKRMIEEKGSKGDLDDIMCILELKEKSDETLQIIEELWTLLMEENSKVSQDQVDLLTAKLSKERLMNSQMKKQMLELKGKISEREIELAQCKLEIINLRKSRSKQDDKIRSLEYQIRSKQDVSQNEKVSFRTGNQISVKTIAKKFETIECSSKMFVNPVKSGPLPSSRKGFFNPRYRRSKSQEQWVEHREKNEIPIGTLNQIKIKSAGKSKNPDLEGLRKGDKYLLQHQVVNQDADVAVCYHKGNIIPTAGGGVAVSLYEVETVTQNSPLKREKKNHKRHSSLDSENAYTRNSKRCKDNCTDEDVDLV